jgi:hypothetical protein
MTQTKMRHAEQDSDGLGVCGGAFMMEQRQFGRRTTWKSARIISTDGTFANCTIVDASNGGARLQLRGREPSQEFTLLIPDDDIAVRCVVIHRDKDQIGVKYLAMPQRLSRLLNGDALRIKKEMKIRT